MKSFWKNYNLSIVLFSLFLLSWIAQTLTGWQEFQSEADLRHRPRWTGSLQARWQPAEAVTLDLEAQAVSRFFDRQIPVEDRRTVDGYELLGLGAAWRFSRPWELRLRVDNLLDESYETLIGFPGPERSVRAGLRWTG